MPRLRFRNLTFFDPPCNFVFCFFLAHPVIFAVAILQLRCQRYWSTDVNETLEIGDFSITMVTALASVAASCSAATLFLCFQHTFSV